METKDIKINHWYMIDRYGYELRIKGKAVEITEDYITFKFYFGDLFFRSRHVVHSSLIIGECNKPPLLSNY